MLGKYTSLFPSLFFKDFIYLFSFRERAREGEGEGEKHQCVREKHRSVASHLPPKGHLAYNLGMCLTKNRTCDC